MMFLSLVRLQYLGTSVLVGRWAGVDSLRSWKTCSGFAGTAFPLREQL